MLLTPEPDHVIGWQLEGVLLLHGVAGTPARKTTRRRANGDEATTAETALAATNPTDKKYVALNGVKLVVDFEMHYETKFGGTV